jgi:hypothetical protein
MAIITGAAFILLVVLAPYQSWRGRGERGGVRALEGVTHALTTCATHPPGIPRLRRLRYSSSGWRAAGSNAQRGADKIGGDADPRVPSRQPTAAGGVRKCSRRRRVSVAARLRNDGVPIGGCSPEWLQYSAERSPTRASSAGRL